MWTIAVIVSRPPLAVPPSSRAVTVTVVVPGTNAGVNVSSPPSSTTGWPPVVKRSGRSATALKETA